MAKRSKKTGGTTACKKPQSKKTGGTTSCKKPQSMKVTSRIVNVRRHTTHYMVGGKKYSVSQIRNLAAKGRVRGVQVVGNHIQAVPGGKRLTDLPTKVMK